MFFILNVFYPKKRVFYQKKHVEKNRLTSLVIRVDIFNITIHIDLIELVRVNCCKF